MSWGHHPRVRFTPKLWARWQARLRENDTERALHLRAGIQEFRALLARYDVRRRR